jgi:hypothetical protein
VTLRRNQGMDAWRSLQIVLLCLLLVGVVGIGAYVLYPVLVPGPRTAELPSTGRALRRVPVWVGDRDDLRIVVRPVHQWPEADREHDRRLAADLFPSRDGDAGHPDARFAVIWLFHYGAGPEIGFDRQGASVVLEHEDGRRVVPLNVPLAAARARLRPDVRLGLETLNAHLTRVWVPPGSFRRVLLALPDGVGLDDLASVEILGLALARRQVIRNRLEGYLADPGDREALLEGAQ